MEWGIFFTVVGLYTIKVFVFAKEYLKNPEPRGPFQRPTGRSFNQFIAVLRENNEYNEYNEYNEALKRGFIPEKVNWKEEGF